MVELNGQVDQLLDERRPERYDLDGGDDWLDGIATEIAPQIPAPTAAKIVARQIVRRREVAS